MMMMMMMMIIIIIIITHGEIEVPSTIVADKQKANNITSAAVLENITLGVTQNFRRFCPRRRSGAEGN